MKYWLTAHSTVKYLGLTASMPTLSSEACREQLQEVLEGWIVLGLRLGHKLPEIDGVRLDPNVEVA
jgi:hypothetical protein